MIKYFEYFLDLFYKKSLPKNFFQVRKKGLIINPLEAATNVFKKNPLAK